MLFASLPFLFGFLPLVLGASFVLGKRYGPRATMLFLAAASFVFYGWHHPPSIVLLVSSIALNYVLAQRIHVATNRFLLTVGAILNLTLLGFFKYATFFMDNVASLTGVDYEVGAVLLPLGISFFTFQQIAYLVDIHRRKVAPGQVLDYVFFVAFFPQLIAGPIVHHRELMPQLSGPKFARFLQSDVLVGILLFAIGLAKKVLIADSFRPYADTLFHAQSLGLELSLAEAWVGMLCYAFQIYFDFSGYSDMAMGLGRMFGLRIPMNFFAPYKSASIIDFWRHWNITLSHFLRDYLYYPLGGNRRSLVRRYANLWIVMLLGGLWHGAGWQFVVWGGLHGFYLTVNHAWRYLGWFALPRSFATLVTFTSVVIAWVFFRAESFDQAFSILAAMFGAGPLAEIAIFSDKISLYFMLIVAVAIVWAAPNSVQISERFEQGDMTRSRARLWFTVCGAYCALSVWFLFSEGSYAFIYFQF